MMTTRLSREAATGAARFRWRLCCLLALLLVSRCVAADLVLRTAAQLDTEPKFVSNRGRTEGLCPDIHRALEASVPGLRVVGDTDWMPLARIERLLDVGALDIVCGLLLTESREQRFQIPKVVLFPVQWRLVVRHDDPIEVNHWEDVRVLGDEGVILLNHGLGTIDLLRERPGLQLDTSGRTSAENLQKLLARRGRFFYFRSPGLEREVARFAGRVRVLPVVMESLPYYMVIGPHVPQTAVKKIEEGLQTLERRGELKRIFERWRHG